MTWRNVFFKYLLLPSDRASVIATREFVLLLVPALNCVAMLLRMWKNLTSPVMKLYSCRRLRSLMYSSTQVKLPMMHMILRICFRDSELELSNTIQICWLVSWFCSIRVSRLVWFVLLWIDLDINRAFLVQSVQCLTTDWTIEVRSPTRYRIFLLPSASRPALGPTQPPIQ
jgi:hypothetical protein